MSQAQKYRDGVEGEGKLASKWRSFHLFLWNPNTRTVMGRGATSWGLLILYYVLFYAILAGFCIALLSVFLTTVENDTPKWAKEQPILVSPGLNYFPREDMFNDLIPLITFTPAKPSSYEELVNQLNKKLEGYPQENSTMVEDCYSTDSYDCNLELSQLGDCDGTHDPKFGYDVGKPCVLLRLNKIFGWKPTPHTTNPSESLLGGRWNSYSIGVACEETAGGRIGVEVGSNLNEVQYFPPSGFSSSCFPFCGKTSPYFSPLVMAKLNNITFNKDVMVWCRVWEANLVANQKSGIGSAVFRMHITS